MQPISRETITDRRQPYIRWTAVIAGSLVALGSWLLLQLLLTGGALSAIDPDNIDNARGYGIGTSIGSVLAPLLAMFLGGLVAGRLADHHDSKVSAFHGALVWTIASVAGLALLGSAVSSMVNRNDVTTHAQLSAPPPGAADIVDTAVQDLNVRQNAANAPDLSKSEILDAARYSMVGRETFDRNAFVVRLDDKTSLSRPEAEAALANLGDRSNDVILAANDLAIHRERALAAAEAAGKAMLGAGLGLLLCLIAAAGGGLLGTKLFRRRGGRIDRSGDTVVEPAVVDYAGRAATPYTTAPYPTITPER